MGWRQTITTGGIFCIHQGLRSLAGSKVASHTTHTCYHPRRRASFDRHRGTILSGGVLCQHTSSRVSANASPDGSATYGYSGQRICCLTLTATQTIALPLAYRVSAPLTSCVPRRRAAPGGDRRCCACKARSVVPRQRVVVANEHVGGTHPAARGASDDGEESQPFGAGTVR